MDSTLIALNKPAGPFIAYCDPDEILAFALAINDSNPLYLSGVATPPTYAVVPAFIAYKGLEPLSPDSIEGTRGPVHGTHDLYIHKRIEPAVHLHTTAERCTVITSRAGMNVVARLTSRDEAGEVVVEQFWAALWMGSATGGNRGVDLADHSFPEPARANAIGSVILGTTRDQTYRYAGASGDRNPMHVNDDAAKQVGFPRKFSQGLCTLGIVSRGLIDLAADGDPARIYRIAVRFTAPAFPGDDIEVTAYELGTTDRGLHAYGFEAVSGGRTVLRHGRVEVHGS